MSEQTRHKEGARNALKDSIEKSSVQDWGLGLDMVMVHDGKLSGAIGFAYGRNLRSSVIDVLVPT